MKREIRDAWEQIQSLPFGNEFGWEFLQKLKEDWQGELPGVDVGIRWVFEALYELSALCKQYEKTVPGVLILDVDILKAALREDYPFRYIRDQMYSSIANLLPCPLCDHPNHYHNLNRKCQHGWQMEGDHPMSGCMCGR